jgi:hypothetical protein
VLNPSSIASETVTPSHQVHLMNVVEEDTDKIEEGYQRDESSDDESLPELISEHSNDDFTEIVPTPPATPPTLGKCLHAWAKVSFPSLFNEKVGFPPLRHWVHHIDTG